MYCIQVRYLDSRITLYIYVYCILCNVFYTRIFYYYCMFMFLFYVLLLRMYFVSYVSVRRKIDMKINAIFKYYFNLEWKIKKNIYMYSILTLIFFAIGILFMIILKSSRNLINWFLRLKANPFNVWKLSSCIFFLLYS